MASSSSSVQHQPLRSVSLSPRHWDSNTLVRCAQEVGDAAADGRTARETILRLDSPVIHQQSRERTCGCSCAGISRQSKKLDNSPQSTELGLWNSFQQCGICRRGEDCLGRRQVQSSMELKEGTRSQQDRYCVTAPRQSVAQQVNGKNIWMPSSPSLEPARGGACFGSSTF